MASNVGIASEHGTDTKERIGLSGDEAWYSITLTNYDRGQRRKRFEELASFLCISMKYLFDARPHWGKLCPLPTDALRSLYPAFNEFRHVCDQVDKDGVFRNFQGKCFASIVGFQFRGARLFGVPVPFHQNFEEVNLRFYVRREMADGPRRGVVFVKEIVPKPGHYLDGPNTLQRELRDHANEPSGRNRHIFTPYGFVWLGNGWSPSNIDVGHC